MNMQDDDGNTALHLAVEAGSLRMFCYLLGNRQVNLNLVNRKGRTPLDIAQSKIPQGGLYSQQVINTFILL
jgi:ankyrin repeat protein